MTACVNKKSKRVAAVVTASLVGALSIGAPAVALAANGTSIDMLAASVLANAKITKATDGKASISGSLENLTFAKGKYLVPTELTNGDVVMDLTDEDAEYTVNYYNASNKRVASTDSTKTQPSTYFATAGSGVYYVEVVKGASADGSEKTDKFAFKVAGEQGLTGVHAYLTDPESDSITFNGSFFVKYEGSEVVSSIKFADGEGSAIPVDAQDVTWKNSEGTDITPKKENDRGVFDAGTYYAEFKYNSVDYTVKVVISPLDLSKAALSIDDTTDVISDSAACESLIKLDGVTIPDTIKNRVKVALTSSPEGSIGFAGTGAYTVSVAADKSVRKDDNVIGEGSISFHRLAKEALSDSHVSSIKYGTKVLNGQEFSLLDGEAFDASKVSVKSDYGTFTGDQLEVSYLKYADDSDLKGTIVATAEDLSKPGKFDIVVRVKPVEDFANGWIGGTATATVTVTGSSVDADKALTFVVDGEGAAVSGSQASATLEYDGTDLLKKVVANVKDGGKTYVQGTDFTLEVKDEDGKVVESIVNANSSSSKHYTVTVKPVTFVWANDAASKVSLDLTVSKKKLTENDTKDSRALKDFTDGNGSVTSDMDAFDASKDASLFYTGSELELPAAMVDTDKSDKASFSELDKSLYEVSGIKYADTEDDAPRGKSVKVLKDEGFYAVTIELTEDAAKNYEFDDSSTSATFIVEVKEKVSFADVAAEKWYAQSVFAAKMNSYVNGIAGTKVFMPEANITRADAVCILFNMANGSIGTNDDFGYDDNHGYITGFNDVDGKAYYGKAIAWAKAAGVANGSNGSFRPNDSITREEFAALLCNFAKAKGENVKVDSDAVLAGATDFSAWAKDVVAWAKDNKVMGNGGFINGTGAITRAEVASMAVNYQPKKLTK